MDIRVWTPGGVRSGSVSSYNEARKLLNKVRDYLYTKSKYSGVKTTLTYISEFVKFLTYEVKFRPKTSPRSVIDRIPWVRISKDGITFAIELPLRTHDIEALSRAFNNSDIQMSIHTYKGMSLMKVRVR